MNFFEINPRVLEASQKAMELCTDKLREIERIQEYHQTKMIKAFQNAGVRESYFCGSTGYGYDDFGRDALDRVYAYVFDAEDALVRHNFVSGTHALTVALFGVLRPGDTALCVTGMPYDTIRSAIGLEGNYSGSLKDFKINFEITGLKPDGTPDYAQIRRDIEEKKPKMVYIQRSRGYSTRPTLTYREIKKICDISKEASRDSIIMLDNCYGEFTEMVEPLSVGVDMMAGSLIKNPGGGIAPTGGYIAGRADLVEMCSYRLTTPGTGKEIGATLNTSRELFMGAYHAPHVTGEAMKTGVLKAEEMGLCQHRSGNFSIRDEDTGLICITPTGMDRSEMTYHDIVVVNMNAEVVEAENLATEKLAQILRPAHDLLVHGLGIVDEMHHLVARVVKVIEGRVDAQPAGKLRALALVLSDDHLLRALAGDAHQQLLPALQSHLVGMVGHAAQSFDVPDDSIAPGQLYQLPQLGQVLLLDLSYQFRHVC